MVVFDEGVIRAWNLLFSKSYSARPTATRPLLLVMGVPEIKLLLSLANRVMQIIARQCPVARGLRYGDITHMKQEKTHESRMFACHKVVPS